MGVFRKHGVYWIDYYMNGRRQRECIGLDKQVANLAFAQMEGKSVKINTREHSGHGGN